jgi:hypothetical protein
LDAADDSNPVLTLHIRLGDLWKGKDPDAILSESLHQGAVVELCDHFGADTSTLEQIVTAKAFSGSRPWRYKI